MKEKTVFIIFYSQFTWLFNIFSNDPATNYLIFYRKAEFSATIVPVV